MTEKLADYIKNYPELINFLYRLEIPLGFGDKTISEICSIYSIDKYFFDDLLGLLLNKDSFDKSNIRRFGINLTVKYLQNSHKSYLTDYFPKLENYISQLWESEKSRRHDCEVLKKYFMEYKSEVISHLKCEDDEIFPYILNLELLSKKENISSKELKSIETHSINKYITRHNSLDEKLTDLKSILIMHTKPFENSGLVRDLLITLFNLEKDLQLHELIEEQILFPQAVLLESTVINNYNQR